MWQANRHTLVRVASVSLYSLGVLYLFKLLILPFEIPMNPWLLGVIYVLGFNLASGGNMAIDSWLDRRMPWGLGARKRILVQLGATVVWVIAMTGLIFVVRLLVWEHGHVPDPRFPAFALYTVIFGAVFLVFYNAVEIGTKVFRDWKSSLLEIERLKQEKLKMDYRLLQDQLNPHFLFNSLNVLVSEISHNPDTAKEFTRGLSRVYRYVLQSRNHDVVTLQEEIDFIQSFIFLHAVRMGDALRVRIAVDDAAREHCLPPLTLQVLVENALKHNEASAEKPLTITIETHGTASLCVANTLQPKDAIDSTHTGLTNIKDRFALLNAGAISIAKTDAVFSVTVPLIER